MAMQPNRPRKHKAPTIVKGTPLPLREGGPGGLGLPAGVVCALTLLLAASLACTVGVAPRSVLDTATPARATETQAAASVTASRPNTATAVSSPSATETRFVPPTL